MAQSRTKIIDAGKNSIAQGLVYTPIGTLLLACTERGVLRCQLTKQNRPMKEQGASSAALKMLREASRQLNNYFADKNSEISLPIHIEGTEFQNQTWKKLTEVPLGKTISYQQLAININKPKAQRAIGGAVNKNPLMIIVPCHRVISKNGSLGGFALPLKIKKWLLSHEGFNDEVVQAPRR